MVPLEYTPLLILFAVIDYATLWVVYDVALGREPKYDITDFIVAKAVKCIATLLALGVVRDTLLLIEMLLLAFAIVTAAFAIIVLALRLVEKVAERSSEVEEVDVGTGVAGSATSVTILKNLAITRQHVCCTSYMHRQSQT